MLAAGMRFVSVPMKGMSAPTDDQIGRALAVLADDSAVPVFVHCKRGADRTGSVIACYRIAFEHWPNRQALEEARRCGMSFLERGMHWYILNYQTRATTVSATGLPAPAR